MNSTQTPAIRQLESATRVFRDRLARGHRIRWVAEHKRAAAALDLWDPHLDTGAGTDVCDEDGVISDATTAAVSEVMQDALSVAKWHHGRDNGQKYRFRKLALCGTRTVIALCRACDSERSPVKEGCGIARLCLRCSLQFAKQRRARFGRARSRASIELARVGFTRTGKKKRKTSGRQVPGGVWSDKMITLTVPHFLLCHVEPGAELLRFGKGAAVDATMARIYAVRAAWPIFSRALRKWFKQGGTSKRRRRDSYDVPREQIGVPLADGTYVPPPMHRAFEWTVGKDGLGHPHFHIWTIAPFIPNLDLQTMWRSALRAVGVPIEKDAYVRVAIQRFRDFDRSAVGELIKGGTTRKALEMSRLYKPGRASGPANAFEYSDGWTIAAALEDARPSVVASLYMALEGARLTQASRGFFLEDEPPSCPTCSAQGCWHVRFEAIEVPLSEPSPNHERAPP